MLRKVQVDGKTYELADNTRDILIEMALRKGVGLEEALTRAVIQGKLLEDQIAGGLTPSVQPLHPLQVRGTAFEWSLGRQSNGGFAEADPRLDLNRDRGFG